MSDSTQNNRMHHREWYDKKCRRIGIEDQGGKSGIVAGFEYAVQPDGSSLAERLWQAGRNTPRHFEFKRSAESSGKLYQISCQSIESSIFDSSQRYQQRSVLPAIHKSDEKGALFSVKMPTHPEGPPFLSPSRRIRNRHNAVYGQHLPNALNSPGCAMKVFGNQGIQHDERDRVKKLLDGGIGSDHGKSTNKENLSPQDQKPAAKYLDIDDDDEFLAEIDLDQLIAQRGKQQQQPKTHPMEMEFDYGNDNWNGSDFNRRSSISENSMPRSENSAKNPYLATTFNDTETPASVDSGIFNRGGARSGSTSMASLENKSWSATASSGASSSFGGARNSSFSTDSCPSTFVNKGANLFASSSIPGDADHRSSSGTALSFHTAQQDSYSNSFNSTAAIPAMISDMNVPKCLGHNRPCRILTASTSTNAGRQFYKCSMPDGDQCDFFEWADGQEGNWNNHEDFSGVDGSRYTTRGHVLDIYQENRRKFGHCSFRPGQKDVIEHAMEGQDVFVLMPTGGGKSLCYQLPAWCSPGLSVVISPLLSLIQDQVQSLKKLGVESVFLNSAQDYETEQKNITTRLFQATDHGGIKLLYITPEKLRHSNMIQNILKRLYEKNLLSRFVVDEAHCMSDWAHDFRPDYGQLGMLRRQYPTVPMMALTATANEKVVNDAIRALGMRNEYRFKSSFNRPNLHYEVRKKDGKSIEKIGEYIVTRPNDSGVIYCLSRKDCETVSEALQLKLNEKGFGHVLVSFYHAELDDPERTRRHREWSSGKISVLCATIAFGMGIDKPDVRFVIHFSMPKSITHYYQESGRAGRDGANADCILYYAYKDKKVLETMIRRGSTNPNSQSTRRKIDQLYTCLRYCENEFICRRTIQLEFFGEKFAKSNCNKTCDNCKAGLEAERRDLTTVACQMLQLLQDISSQKNGRGVTMVQLTDLFKGSKSKSATKFLNVDRLKGCGAGKAYSKPDLDRIVHAMVYDKILVENAEDAGGGFTADYIRPGENALATQNKQRPFFVEFPKARSKAAAASAAKKPDSEMKKKATPKKKNLPKTKESKKPGPGIKAVAGKLSLSDFETSDEDEHEEDRKVGNKASAVKRLLPLKMTQALVARVKKLVGMWADEEQMNGNRVFCKSSFGDSTLNLCILRVSHPLPFRCRLAYYQPRCNCGYLQ